MVTGLSTADRVIAALGDALDYSAPDRSFSPCYSDMGLGFNDEGGIACLFLHYNRRTTAYGSPFLSVDGALVAQENTALGVRQRYQKGTVDYAFYARNTWLIECEGGLRLTLRMAAVSGVHEARREDSGDMLLYEGYLPTLDPRDPDPYFPFILGLRVLAGSLASGDGISEPLVLAPDAAGRILAALSISMLDVSHKPLSDLMQRAPGSCGAAREITRQWFVQALGDLPCVADEPEEEAVLAKAAFTLAFNSSMAPGYLAGRVSAFPSRGGYPTHFLWDSCFQNLALEHMDPRLAVDSMLLLTENLRPDGKMAHFLCSTWMRPNDSQPPLVGWAGLRLVKRRNDLDLAHKLLPALIKNTGWWLSQRMTRFGLIQCLNPLETGWDDSPRLDRGPTLACDMNSHLLLQMRAVAEMARLVGDDALAYDKAAEADRYAARMVRVLYDPVENLFKEVLVETGEMLPIKTPACFLPLLAGVPLAEEKARDMIEGTLLHPKRFYGPIPFPCVAYDEAAYQPEKWWRGPTWLPVAYLMLELLAKFGYDAARREAAERLFRMIIRDEDIHEFFDSQTGQGMGKAQQGWTAAICLQLKAELG